jgi:hypothetical protein
MIRHFERVDLRRIKTNQFSRFSDFRFIFDDEDTYKHTLVDDNGNVQAIICFKLYWRKNAVAFFLISDEMNPIYARELKKFIYQAMRDFDGDRIQTDSVDCPELNRWHKFLGFTLEGKREKMIYDQDYNMWALLKGRDF